MFIFNVTGEVFETQEQLDACREEFYNYLQDKEDNERHETLFPEME